MATGKRLDPYRNYRFRIVIDGIQTAAFADATIPDTSTEAVDYREGIDAPHARKLSGLTKFGNITLKKGLTDSLELYNWRKSIEDKGALKNRKSLSIILVDEEGNDKAQWDILEAWPIKYDVSALSAKGNEVSVESMELVHEGVRRVK
ncbi:MULTISPECIES: phage tail protein [unclassified Paenibacillus]|uniref:phage tail protein n=1 Tax=unclassified Paenibacillus TaxID=185978 RepID=UPI0030F4E52C